MVILMDSGYEHVSHTADVKIRAWAPTLAVAFIEACRGYTAVIIDPRALAGSVEKIVALRARSKEALLYDLIAEIVYYADVEGFLPSGGSLKIERDQKHWMLRGTLVGERRTTEMHGAVKAMTYHELKIDERPKAASVEFVLDL